jgi:hypothetical protein
MEQHTYSFPKVSPADPHELRETLRASRREAAGTTQNDTSERTGDDRRRPDQRAH